MRLGDAQVTDEYELHKALSGDIVGKTIALRILRAEKVSDLRVTPKEAEY